MVMVNQSPLLEKLGLLFKVDAQLNSSITDDQLMFLQANDSFSTAQKFTR